MRINALIACALLLLLAGCADPKIDASSDEAMKKSIASAKKRLNDEEKEAFEQALLVLAVDDVNLLTLAADPDGIERRLKDKIDGKTVDEVIVLAEEVKAERETAAKELNATLKEQTEKLKESNAEKEKELIKQITTEVKDLQRQKVVAEVDKHNLKNFNVLSSRFFWHKSRFSEDAIIALEVQNRTQHAISRAYFTAVLQTPGRSVPWVDDGFNYEISGGLESGESDTWNLQPNRFGEWGKAPRDRDDMVLTVEVVRIDGPDGEAIFDSEFPKSSASRLERLIDDLKEMGAPIPSPPSPPVAEKPVTVAATTTPEPEPPAKEETAETPKPPPATVAEEKPKPTEEEEEKALQEYLKRNNVQEYSRYRTFTDSTGTNKIKARIIAVDGDKVQLEREDKKEIWVPIEKLGKIEQIRVKKWKEAQAEKE